MRIQEIAGDFDSLQASFENQLETLIKQKASRATAEKFASNKQEILDTIQQALESKGKVIDFVVAKYKLQKEFTTDVYKLCSAAYRLSRFDIDKYVAMVDRKYLALYSDYIYELYARISTENSYLVSEWSAVKSFALALQTANKDLAWVEKNVEDRNYKQLVYCAAWYNAHYISLETNLRHLHFTHLTGLALDENSTKASEQIILDFCLETSSPVEGIEDVPFTFYNAKINPHSKYWDERYRVKLLIDTAEEVTTKYNRTTAQQFILNQVFDFDMDGTIASSTWTLKDIANLRYTLNNIDKTDDVFSLMKNISSKSSVWLPDVFGLLTVLQALALVYSFEKFVNDKSGLVRYFGMSIDSIKDMIKRQVKENAEIFQAIFAEEPLGPVKHFGDTGDMVLELSYE